MNQKEVVVHIGSGSDHPDIEKMVHEILFQKGYRYPNNPHPSIQYRSKDFPESVQLHLNFAGPGLMEYRPMIRGVEKFVKVYDLTKDPNLVSELRKLPKVA